MPSLQVRDVPPGLYERLKARAEAEHRSMAQQTIVALEEHLAQRERNQGSGQTTRAARRADGPLRVPPNETFPDVAAMQKRRLAVLEHIKRAPLFDLPADCVSEADLIQQARAERDEQAERTMERWA